MKIWLFRLIAVAIPIIFFVIFEFALRLAGYGHDYPLFIENPADNQYLLPRPDIVKRYFSQQQEIPNVSIEANFFRKHKPENGLRFFVQGGSTAAGFPYGLSASIAGNLDQRLKQSFPKHYVEVVNTALAAVNSYTVMDLVEEVIEQQPDGILIYMGHNEFLGIMGVGSNFTAANSHETTLLFLKLKELRIFQLLQSFYGWLKIEDQANDNDLSQEKSPSRTLMAKIAKHKDIPLNSELFQAGLAQFKNNLTVILREYQQAKVPVFISTLASNVSDQTPFSSIPADKLVVEALEKLGQQITTNRTMNRTELSSMVDNVEELVVDSQSADVHFQFATHLKSLGENARAKRHFIQSKDLDLLRFRAPEAFNSIIEELANLYGANLVDAKKRFEQRATNGLVGKQLMLEHLHPNVEGYFLLSDAFYQAMLQAATLPKLKTVPIQQAWQQRPLLPVEEYYGFAKVRQLTSDYPFTQKKTPVKLPFPKGWEQQLGRDLFAKKIDWLSMTRSAQRIYDRNKNTEQLLKTQLLIADALPHDIKENLKAANMLNQLQDGRAVSYFQRAIWAGDDSARTANAIKTVSSH